MRGGLDGSTDRIVMSAILRDVAGSKPQGMRLKDFAAAWEKPEGTIRRWASKQFQHPHSIWNTPENRARIGAICRQVGLEPSPEFLQVILSSTHVLRGPKLEKLQCDASWEDLAVEPYLRAS